MKAPPCKTLPHHGLFWTHLCRDEAPCAILGIWPEFALANHSCMPSAVHMVVGGCMVVR